MKKMMLVMVTLLAATTVVAAPKKTGAKRAVKAAPAAEADAPAIEGREGQVSISAPVRLGRQACFPAPSLQGQSSVGQVFKKPRNWIVLEAKYETFAKWQDQLTFTWHVLLDSKTATENKGGESIAPYSYFTTQINYMNIPKGFHVSSAVLHPSYLERFGEPKAVGVVITDKNGAVVGGDSWSEVNGIKAGTLFWDDAKIMEATSGGEPMIERRSGLVDRAKTIWGLVNPNDYENTVL